MKRTRSRDMRAGNPDTRIVKALKACTDAFRDLSPQEQQRVLCGLRAHCLEPTGLTAMADKVPDGPGSQRGDIARDDWGGGRRGTS